MAPPAQRPEPARRSTVSDANASKAGRTSIVRARASNTSGSWLAVMEAGRLQQVAGPAEVYERPANEFVAGFFGSPRINLVRPSTLHLAAPPGAVRAGVRAEHLEVGLGQAPASAVAGRVFLVEPMGAASYVTVQVGDEKLVARAAPRFSARTSEPAWLEADPTRLHWFDAAGRRLDGGSP